MSTALSPEDIIIHVGDEEMFQGRISWGRYPVAIYDPFSYIAWNMYRMFVLRESTPVDRMGCLSKCNQVILDEAGT